MSRRKKAQIHEPEPKPIEVTDSVDECPVEKTVEVASEVEMESSPETESEMVTVKYPPSISGQFYDLDARCWIYSGKPYRRTNFVKAKLLAGELIEVAV